MSMYGELFEKAADDFSKETKKWFKKIVIIILSVLIIGGVIGYYLRDLF